MTAFAHQGFRQRFEVMGDIAEAAFERFAASNDIRYERYGFNRPNFKRFSDLPLFLRMAPDFICEGKKKFFVECKGTGGKVIKIKEETMRGLFTWSDHLDVWFFIYNSNDNTAAFVNFDEVLHAFNVSPRLNFDDGKEYRAIKSSFFEWVSVPIAEKQGY